MTTYKNYFNPEPNDHYKRLKLFIGLVLLAILIVSLFGCSVLKTKTETVTVYDSVRVVKYDTTKETIETLDFLNKTIEVYDTVHYYDTNRVKVVIPFIVRREKIEYGSATKTETQKGIGSDSTKINREVKEKVKTKKVPPSFWAGAIILALFIYGLYWVGKQNKK